MRHRLSAGSFEGPIRAGVVALVLVLAAGGAKAQDVTEPTSLTRLARPIVVDGMLDEAAWRDVPPLPLTMYAPTFRGEPTQRTEIRVAYDDDAFYAAGWFYDDDPSGIRINSLYRDRWSGDDALAIYIDAFNDNQTAKWFGTTPAGMRFDQLVSDDGATLNGSWDAHWEARTRVTAEGWFAEVRIPFSTLGFQADGERTVMGLTVTRLVSRLNERVTFPAIDPRFPFRQPSVAQDVVLDGVRASRAAYLTPYVLGGFRREPILMPDATGWDQRSGTPAEAGVDLRYALSGNLLMDVTVNTDFAQVEADDRQVNLDRFSLLFPEKRRFFQERSGIFEFDFGTGGRLFHSRTIGLAPDRRPIRVLGGARLVGRVGDWDLGFLDMHTDEHDDLPSENFAVARLSRRILNPYSSLGVLATNRVGAGHRNTAYGVDGTFRLFGNDYVIGKWAQTFDSGEPAGVEPLERAQLRLRWERRAQRGLQYAVGFGRAGEAYDPGVGFIARRDFTAVDGMVQYHLFADPSSRIRRVIPGMFLNGVFRNGDGRLESSRLALWYQLETKGGGFGWIEPQLFREDVAVAFRIADAIDIPAGAYDFANLWLYWSMPAGRRLRAALDVRPGTYFDGTRTQVIFRPTWNASRHFELSADYEGNFLRFEDRGQSADLHLLRVRASTALNARASGNVFVQYDGTADRLGMNVRLRYNFAEGTDLWLVYDEGLRTVREAIDGLPREPLSSWRALTVKYTYTLGI